MMTIWHWQKLTFISVLGLLLITAGLVIADTGTDQLKDAKAIQTVVEALRQQKITSPLKMGVVNKAQVLKFVDQRIAEEFSPAEIREMEDTNKLLELLPASYDYIAEIRAIMTEQIGGFYDHKKQELYIADWISSLVQRPILAHEIFHAVQVQEWNAGSFLDTQTLKNDQLLAHQALLEGDATIVMAHFMVANANLDDIALNAIFDSTIRSSMHGLALKPSVAKFMGSSEKFASAPRFIKRSLVLPYAAGAEFILALRREANWNWKRINQMYKNPPTTTENILRPETYWQKREFRQKPMRMFRLPKNWQLLREDTFGLMMMSEALDRHAPHDKAPLVLKGWAGDETFLLGRNNARVLVINSSWDDAESAQAFARRWKESYASHVACAVVIRGNQVILGHAHRPEDLTNVLTEMGISK